MNIFPTENAGLRPLPYGQLKRRLLLAILGTIIALVFLIFIVEIISQLHSTEAFQYSKAMIAFACVGIYSAIFLVARKGYYHYAALSCASTMSLAVVLVILMDPQAAIYNVAIPYMGVALLILSAFSPLRTLILFWMATTIVTLLGPLFISSLSIFAALQFCILNAAFAAVSAVGSMIRDRYEIEALSQNDFMAAVLANVPALIFVKDPKSLRYLYLNKFGEELLGIRKEDFIGKNDYELFPKDQADFFIAKDREILEGKAYLSIEEEVVQTAKGAKWWSTHKVPIKDNVSDEVLYLLGISQDITEKREQKKLVEAARAEIIQSARLASLGEMAGGIAHEINNPLSVIKGKASVIRDIVENKMEAISMIPAHVEKIDQTVERIARIIKGLRTFARNADGEPVQRYNMLDIINDCLEISRARFRNAGLKLTLRDCTSDNIQFECRPTQIGQVIINLLSNSFDAAQNSEQKWVRIEVEESEETVKVRITDSGDGVTPEALPKLFQPFFTTKKIGEGTGLGLSISKGIIEKHGGRIYFDTASEATSFVFELPRKAIDSLYPS